MSPSKICLRENISNIYKQVQDKYEEEAIKFHYSPSVFIQEVDVAQTASIARLRTERRLAWNRKVSLLLRMLSNYFSNSFILIIIAIITVSATSLILLR